MAIHGAEPTVTVALPKWPPAWSTVSESVASSIADGSWGAYHGRPMDEFIAAFRSFTEMEHIWPCASGTIGVELALRGLGVTKEHQVILSGYDFPGNFRAVEAIGARPVLVDLLENRFVINPAEVEAAITDQTKAVIVSHLHGQLADIQAIHSICRSHSVSVLEDACQVPGATVDGSPAGTLGDAGVFSFGGSKLLTAGRGGAVVTRDESVMQRIRIAAERGNDAFPFSSLQAAALTPQLDLIDSFNRQRLDAARKLQELLKTSRLFAPFHQTINDAWRPAFYKFPLLLTGEQSRETLIAALVAEGLPAAEGFRGFTRRSSRRCDKRGNLENSKRAADCTVLLHHPLLLGDEQLLEQTIRAIRKVETCFTNPLSP